MALFDGKDFRDSSGPISRGFRRGLGRLKNPAQKQGAAPDSIDPQEQVENRPSKRNKPDEPYPENSGAGVPLVKHGMPGGDHRNKQGESRREIMPEMG